MTRPSFRMTLTLNVPHYEEGEEWPVSYVYKTVRRLRVGYSGAVVSDEMSEAERDEAFAKHIAEEMKRELEYNPDLFLQMARHLVSKARLGQFSERIPMSTYVSTEKK